MTTEQKGYIGDSTGIPTVYDVVKKLQNMTLSKNIEEEWKDKIQRGEFFTADGDHFVLDKDKVLSAVSTVYSAGHKAGRVDMRDDLINYVEHEIQCIRSTYSAGRPTENGGYEQKFNDKWYQTKPVDETPKCDCGLEDVLTSLSPIV